MDATTSSGDVAPGSGRMFDGIAARYDLLNRVMSLGLDRRWRRRLVESLALRGDERVLDLATGTGDVARALVARHPELEIVGVDPSERMLEVARGKLARLPRVTLTAGDAQALGFEDASFDAATMAFGIRNVPDRPRALAELHRVLRPGARLAMLELAEPDESLAGRLARLHVYATVPLVGRIVGGAREYRYLRDSIAKFPRRDEFVRTIAAAGFDEARAEPLSFGACVLFTARRG